LNGPHLFCRHLDDEIALPQDDVRHILRSLPDCKAVDGKEFFSWLLSVVDHELLDLIRAARAAKRGGQWTADLSTAVLTDLLSELAVSSRTPGSSAARHEAEIAQRHRFASRLLRAGDQASLSGRPDHEAGRRPHGQDDNGRSPVVPPRLEANGGAHGFSARFPVLEGINLPLPAKLVRGIPA